MSLSDIASVLKSVGSAGFALVLMAFICVTLLTSLIALVKWVLENMVPIEVHTALQSDIGDKVDTCNQLLITRGGGR